MSEETAHSDSDKPAVPSNPLFGVWIDVRSEQPKAEGSYLVYAPSADIDKPLVAIAWFTPGGGLFCRNAGAMQSRIGCRFRIIRRTPE